MGKMKYNPFTDSLDFVNKPSDTAYGASWDGVTDVAPSKNAVYDKIQTLAGGHDAVTLDTNADTLLSLSTQELGLDTQVANTIFAGPASGADAVPTFRALVADDIPDLSGTYLTAESDPLSLHLDQTTPQTITGGVPIGLEGSYTHKITFNMIGTADEQAWVQIPYDCTITGYELTADQSGDIVIDLWVDDYSAFPPTVADTITASAKPTLSSAQKATDSTLTGWTKTLTAGKYILANVDSASTLEKAVLILNVTRT